MAAISPQVGAAIINAGSSLVNGFLGAGANANLNKNNRDWQERVYRERHAMALEDYQRELNDNWAFYRQQVKDQSSQWFEQFNAQNEYNAAYNSPAAQMKRYREAGINPYYAINQMNAGNAQNVGTSLSSASGSAPSVNSVSEPDVSNQLPVNYGAGIGSAVGAFQDTLLKDAQIKNVQQQTIGQQVKNFFDTLSFEDRLSSQHFDTKEKEKRYSYLDQFLQNQLRQANADWENSLANTAWLYTQSQAARDEITLKKNTFELEKAFKNWSMSEGKRLNDATIKQAAAASAQYLSQAGLNRQMTTTEIYKGWQTVLSAYGIKLDNDLKNWTLPYSTAIVANQAGISDQELSSAMFGNSNYSRYVAPNVGNLLHGLGLGAGVFLGLRSPKLKPVLGFGR